MKTCPRCNIEKALDSFGENKSSEDGRSFYCTQCKREKDKEWREKPGNSDKVKVRTDQWAADHPDEIKARARRNHLMNIFKMSEEDYQSMLDGQDGACFICGNPPFGKHRLAVDHDRTCCPGKKSCGHCVRGLLHQKCNSFYGWFEKNRERIRAYEERYKTT